MSKLGVVRQQENDVKEEVIDLREYVRIVKRHLKSIFIIGFISVLVAALIVFSMKPIYQSTATLLIETEIRKVVSIEEVYAGGQQANEYLNTQFELLKSQSLARKMMNELDLINHPYFQPELDEEGNVVSLKATVLSALPDGVSTWFLDNIEGSNKAIEGLDQEELRRREILAELSEMMVVSPVRKTQLVGISFEATDNVLSAKMANAMAKIYIQSQLDARLEMTSQANSWLTERLEVIREKLKTSEEALQTYKEKEELIIAGGVTSLIAKQLGELNLELNVAERNLSSLEAARNQIRDVKNKKYEDYLSIPAVLDDKLVSELINSASGADQELESLSQRYGYKHPKIISAKAGLNTATKALERHVLSVVKGIERQYQLARSAENSAQKALGVTRKDMHSINRKEHRLGILDREAKANRQLYDLFLNRIKETTESTGIDQANARVVDKAIPAIVPIKPKKKLIILIAGFLGLGFGILMAFLYEHLNNTVKSAMDMQERLKLVVLGVLPVMNNKANTLWKIVKLDGKSSFTEGIRTIRTGVILSSLDKPHKTIMVTSSLPNEGKTSTATNTAINLSEMHKVLLIDADLRKPSVGGLFGYDRNTNGLSELLAKTEEPSACVHRWDESDLYIIPAGLIPPNPLELLGSEAFKTMLNDMIETYDYIVIDTPPILPVSDSRLISTLVDGVIFVTKADSTPVPLVKDALNRLHLAKAPILGGVLNQFDASKQQGYGNYADGYYTESYG